MPRHMRNYAEAVATSPCSNVFHGAETSWTRNEEEDPIAVGDRAEDIGGVSGRWRRIDRHLESNSRSFVHSGSRSSMEARILGIRVKFQFRQPAEIYPGSSFKIIDDDRDTSSRRSNPPGIRLVEDEHRQNNSTHDRQPRAFSPRRAIERRRIPLDLVC